MDVHYCNTITFTFDGLPVTFTNPLSSEKCSQKEKAVAFEQDVIKAICDYMNTDPMQSTLTIVQGLTGDRSVTAVEMLGFDETHAFFKVEAPSGSSEINIAWLKPVVERADVRVQLFALLDKASDAFGS